MAEVWRVENPRFYRYMDDCLINNPDMTDNFAHWLAALDVAPSKRRALILEAWAFVENLYSTGELNFEGCGDIVKYVDNYLAKCKECISGRNIVCSRAEKDKCVAKLKNKVLTELAIFLAERLRKNPDKLDLLLVTPSVLKYLPEFVKEEITKPQQPPQKKEEGEKKKETREVREEWEEPATSISEEAEKARKASRQRVLRIGRTRIVTEGSPSCIPDPTVCGYLLATAPLDKSMIQIWRDRGEIYMSTEFLTALRYILLQLLEATAKNPAVSGSEVDELRSSIDRIKSMMSIDDLKDLIYPVVAAYEKYGYHVVQGLFSRQGIRMSYQKALNIMCAHQWLGCFGKVLNGKVDP